LRGWLQACDGLIAIAPHYAWIGLPGNLVIALAEPPNNTQHGSRLYQDAVTPYQYCKIAGRSSCIQHDTLTVTD
jgi:hypothetical protein